MTDCPPPCAICVTKEEMSDHAATPVVVGAPLPFVAPVAMGQPLGRPLPLPPLALSTVLPFFSLDASNLHPWSGYRLVDSRMVQAVAVSRNIGRDVITCSLSSRRAPQFQSPDASLQFQVQEMLRIEKIFEAQDIQEELDA